MRILAFRYFSEKGLALRLLELKIAVRFKRVCVIKAFICFYLHFWLIYVLLSV